MTSSSTGLVTALPDMKGLDLVGLDDLVFGGCDIRDASIVDRAWSVHREHGVIAPATIEAVASDLRSRTGRPPGTSSTSRASSARGCRCSSRGRGATRCWPRRWCWTSSASPTSRSGVMTHTACFFKDPIGGAEHNLAIQFQALLEYAGAR